jgi:hypothetical protein
MLGRRLRREEGENMKLQIKVKIIIFSLLLIILGIIGLYISFQYVSDQVFKEISKSIFFSIITAALFTVIMNIFTRDHFEETIKELIEVRLPFLDRLHRKGLIEFEESFPLKVDIYENDFMESNTITIVMNDAKKFYSNNISLFRERFRQKNKITNFVILDPAAADSISVITRKNGHEGNYYVDKINDFIKELHKEEHDNKHIINIYLQNLFNTMAIIMTEKYAMVSLYRISPGKDDVPHLVFEKNEHTKCEYFKVERDVEKLMKMAKKLT